MATVVAAWTRSFVEYAEARGIERRGLLAEAGLATGALAGGDERIATNVDTALWRFVARELGDDDLGLEFAECGMTDASLGVVGILARASGTVEDGLRTAAQFHTLIKDDGSATFALRDGVGTLRWLPSPTERTWYAPIEDAIVANCVLLARRWTGEAIAPLRLRCQRSRPPEPERYEALLGCVIEYGCEATEIEFSPDVLALPLATCHAELAPYLNVAATTFMRELGGGKTLDERVLEAFTAVGTDLSEVARALGVSRRTLQRHLSESGTRYQALVDEHRRRTAFALMQDPSLTVIQIAHGAGFADASSYRRALRRWLDKKVPQEGFALGRTPPQGDAE